MSGREEYRSAQDKLITVQLIGQIIKQYHSWCDHQTRSYQFIEKLLERNISCYFLEFIFYKPVDRQK